MRTSEPEDAEFVFRRWFEMQFLVVSLIRLQNAARMFRKAKGVEIDKALDGFKAALPGLRELRDVAEHIEEYAVDSSKRKHKQIKRRALAVGNWDGTTIEWFGGSLNVDSALLAAQKLFAYMQAEKNRFVMNKASTETSH